VLFRSSRGGTISTVEGVAVQAAGSGVTVYGRSGQTYRADAAVVATGAWLSAMAREWGVRVPVRAGRGYSFTVPVDREIPGPIYLPEVRVACTPYQGALRGAGTREFRKPDA